MELTELELRHTQQLLQTERTMHSGRLQSLEQQVGFLQRFLDSEHYHKTQLIEALTNISESTTPIARNAIDQLINMIRDGNILSDQNAAVDQLVTAAKEDRSIIQSLEDLLLRGAIQGAAGNYLYAWLQALATIFR